MSCCKYTLRNNSNQNANFNYKKCDDAILISEEIINPFETLEIFCFKDSLTSQFDTVQIIKVECEKILPTRTPTKTPGFTPTVTPSVTATPAVTPTSTIPVTPSNTPTSSPFVSGSFSIIFFFFNFGNNLVRFTVGGNSIFKMTIDWGDGSTTFYDGLTTYFPTHTYDNSIGTYSCSIIVNGITYVNSLDFSYSNNSTFNNVSEVFVSSLTSLEYLNLSNNKLTYVPYPLPSSLLYLFLSNNEINNFPSLSQPLPPLLYVLDLQYNQLTSFTTTQPLPSLMTDLFLNFNPIVSFTQTQSLPVTLETINLEGCSLSSSELNNCVSFLNSTPYVNGISLNLSNQTTSGCVDSTSPSWLSLINKFQSISANIC